MTESEGNLMIYYEYVTVDDENIYIAKGGLDYFSSRGKIEITNIDRSNFPNAIIVPKKYVNMINGAQLHIGEKSKIFPLKVFKYDKLVFLDFSSDSM